MLLVTPSLLNSFLYYTDYDVGFSENDLTDNVRKDFLRTLSRTKSEPTEAMQKGIDFENEVYSICNGNNSDCKPAIEIANIVKGGLWQQTLKKEFGQYLLYARADVVKADTIYDIKYIIFPIKCGNI